jgi:hypothetical protein
VLKDKGFKPKIYHEYIEEDKVWHSYFAIDVINDE